MATKQLSDQQWVEDSLSIASNGRVGRAHCPNCALVIRVGKPRQRKTCHRCRAVYTTHFDLDSRTVRFFQIHPPALTTKSEATVVSPEEIKKAVHHEVAGMVPALRDAARQAVADMAPIERVLIAPIVSKSATKPTKKRVKTARHKAYDECMTCASAMGQAFFVGPAGSGKSTLARQIAQDLDRKFGMLPCTQGLSEAHILGRMLGNGEYLYSDFIRIFENGGVFLFDEVDAGDANTLLVINEALANGQVSVPNRPKKPIAVRHPETLIFCAGNTWGQGSDMEYVGRNQLDAAFLDRFVGGIVYVDYDRDREQAIANAHGIDYLASSIWRIRENVQRSKIRRPISTRWFLNLGRFASVATEISGKDLVARAMKGWSDTEVAKAMEGVVFEDEPIDVPSPAGGSIPSFDIPKCPVCEKPMRKRMANRGPHAGKEFWGCLGFPACRGTRPVEE